MIERLAECIRKLKVVVDMESNRDKKLFMTMILNGMQSEYDIIVKENIPCPPEMIEKVSQSLKLIEDMYDKIACN